MCPVERQIKDTAANNVNISDSYLDILLSIRMDNQLQTSVHNKRQDFNFIIVNFPILSSNIPPFHANGFFFHLTAYTTPGLFLM